MSSTYYLFLNLAIGCFALSVLYIRGQRLKNRYATDIDLRLDPHRKSAVFGVRPSNYAQVDKAQPLNRTSCVCVPESPYQFMNMWEIISETSLESR